MAKAQVQAVEKKITLHGLAVQAYRDFNGNIKAAKETIIEELSTDKKLLAAIVEDAISNAVSYSLHKVATGHRNTITRAAESPAKMQRANVVALASGLAAGYMDWPLANGVKLRDATREDLITSIDRYSAQASSLQTRTQWLQLVLQSMPDGVERVGDMLTEERLKELYNEVSVS